jgi:hypothetical protein
MVEEGEGNRNRGSELREEAIACLPVPSWTNRQGKYIERCKLQASDTIRTYIEDTCLRLSTCSG